VRCNLFLFFETCDERDGAGDKIIIEKDSAPRRELAASLTDGLFNIAITAYRWSVIAKGRTIASADAQAQHKRTLAVI